MKKPKWTQKAVKAHLVNMLLHVQKTHVNYLGNVLLREGLHNEVWPQWKKVFAKNQELMPMMRQIEKILCGRSPDALQDHPQSKWQAMNAIKNDNTAAIQGPEADREFQAEIDRLDQPAELMPDTNMVVFLPDGDVIIVEDEERPWRNIQEWQIEEMRERRRREEEMRKKVVNKYLLP